MVYHIGQKFNYTIIQIYLHHFTAVCGLILHHYQTLLHTHTTIYIYLVQRNVLVHVTESMLLYYHAISFHFKFQ